MICLKVKKYRGARILIINEWYEFLVIVYMRGEFYTTKVDAIKRGEYNAKEYAEASEFALREAKTLIDAIIKKKSIINKIKQTYAKIRISIGIPQGEQGQAKSQSSAESDDSQVSETRPEVKR